MSKPSAPQIPDPGAAAAAGIAQNTQLQPFNYLINAASTLGRPITINGQTYDFTGLGQADTAAVVSDQMARTLLALQQTNDPQVIQERLNELQAADPQGYAARQTLFDQIQQQAQNNPGRPISTDLQQQLQNELAKGAGFNDAKQEEQAREGIRGNQVKSGITLGQAPTAQEAAGITSAGENLQSQRQQDALNLLESGSSPEDIAYRQLQQNLSNEANFVSGQTPTAQFQQVSAARSGPTQLVGGAPSTNTFDPNAAANGQNNALAGYGAQNSNFNAQANPWLAGLSVGATTYGSLAGTNWGSLFNSRPSNFTVPYSSYSTPGTGSGVEASGTNFNA